MRGAHPLGTAEGRTCQDTEKKQSSEGHPPGNAEGGTSQDIKKEKASKGTHQLDIVEGGTNQDTKESDQVREPQREGQVGTQQETEW